MMGEQHKAEQTIVGKTAAILSLVLFGLYAANVLIGKAIIVFGWEVFHVGNVGEFLLLFASSIAFIVAALQSEAVIKNRSLKTLGGDHE